MSQGNSSNFTVGILVILMGGLALAIGFGVIGAPSQINAPPWLIAIFSSLFILAGIWTILRQTLNQDTVQASWTNFLFALLIMLAIAVVCLWISFGAGDKMFTNSAGPVTDRTYVPANPILGRIFFGTFGILMLGAMVAVAIRQGRKMLGTRSK